MPEIAEGETFLVRMTELCTDDILVARLVHFLRQHLVGKKIATVVAPDDVNIFGKVGCSGPTFEKALKGRKVCIFQNLKYVLIFSASDPQ